MKNIVIISDCVDVANNEIRGAILSNCSSDNVNIEPIVIAQNYNIVNVNFLVKLTAEIYPEGTIICVVVNPLKLRTERIAGITKRKSIIFEGTNTGAFGWLLDDFGCSKLIELSDPGFVPFGGKYVHAPAVGKIASDVPFEKLGHEFPIEKLRKAELKTGTILHIDNFGNLKLYHKFDMQIPNLTHFKITINDEVYHAIYTIRMMELTDGTLAIYPGSSFGYTELGIVRGDFAATLGDIKCGDIVTIERELDCNG